MIVPTPADDQHAVIAFLSDPASHGADAVDRIESHCSIVFLVADRAYKLKRAIRYASLDYTSRTARQNACEAELVLNRRTAPELYLGVRAITREAAGLLAFDGVGEVLDHVVVMRRFAQSDLFDALLQRGMLTPNLMHALGTCIAQFHLGIQPTPTHGGSDAMRRVIVENARELALVAIALDGAAVDTMGERARAALGSLEGLLDRRRAAGKVRRCHGDLRLANICLYAGRPTLFDCIEFSDEVGCIDVLYDLAFLLMDLHLRDRGDLANAVFNAYADVAPDTEGLRALPLFLALRAATRSYALAGSAQRQADPRRAVELMVQARRHIAASLAFLAPAPPRLLALGGGNEHERCEMAERLAAWLPPAPGARIVPLTQAGEANWREADETLAAGCSVVLRAPFDDDATRARAAALAKTRSVSFEGRWAGPVPFGLAIGTWRRLSPSDRVLDPDQNEIGPTI
ncbi:MAG TPA: phosphotransferase [Rhodopila sp.]|uniref:phosphotransferase n=1 Tax=Rhodopila sp. TaxID=2480087 RepID=UPI002C8415FC|nr:phosphotransferase [Rhodopila sp.]HVY14122.1 phosphotransferase [Rhodopila sp.]